MAKSNQTLSEIRWHPVVDGDLLTKSNASSSNNNNQDVLSLFNSALDGIFAALSTKSNDVPSVLPVSNYQDGIFTGLSTKSTVPSKATFLPVPHYQDGGMFADLLTERAGSSSVPLKATVLPDPDHQEGIFSDSWTKGSASSSVPSKRPLLMFPEYGETMTKNNQTHADSVPMSGLSFSMLDDRVQRFIKASVLMSRLHSTRLDHHVQRAIKENEDLVPLENFNEDRSVYHIVREVVNRVIFSDFWTKVSAYSSLPSKGPLLMFPEYGDSVPMSGPCFSRLDHHVQRAIKEKENYAVEDYPHSQNLVPLEDFNEDHYLYHFVREVLNRIIYIKRTGSCSSDPLFLPKATAMSDHDHKDGIFSDFWTKGSAFSSVPSKATVLPDPDHRDVIFSDFWTKGSVSSSVPSKATVLPDPDNRDKKKHKATPIDPAGSEDPNQKIVSYPKVSLVEPFSEQPVGGGISKSDFKNFVVEDYPHPWNSIPLVYSKENHYSYNAVRKCVNLALEDYIKQTELIYELVDVVKVSWVSLTGALYYITFKATSPQKELTTFEAEVMNGIKVTKVWRVGIRKSGSDWFDGVVYFPKFKRQCCDCERENAITFAI